MSNCLAGKSKTIYFLPHLLYCKGYSDQIKDDNINEFVAVVEENPPDYSAEFGEFAEIIDYHGIPRVLNSC